MGSYWLQQNSIRDLIKKRISVMLKQELYFISGLHDCKMSSRVNIAREHILRYWDPQFRSTLSIKGILQMIYLLYNCVESRESLRFSKSPLFLRTTDLNKLSPFTKNSPKAEIAQLVIQCFCLYWQICHTKTAYQWQRDPLGHVKLS